MLSILIPTFDRNAYPLAKTIENQALGLGILFEIICKDDGSKSSINIENEKINTLTKSTFSEEPINIGRAAIRNKLAKEANYEWILFLDSDVEITNPHFLKNYLAELNSGNDAVFGGFKYQEKNLNPQFSLRHTFGKKREEVDCNLRNKKPYKIIISANFVIKRNAYLTVTKSLLENTYGMDYAFGASLKQHGVSLKHINNEVLHLGLDDNETFLSKTKKAVEKLHDLYFINNVELHDISLLNYYRKLEAVHCQRLFGKSLHIFEKAIIKNLTSEKPSLFLFDLYRLGYFCNLKKP